MVANSEPIRLTERSMLNALHVRYGAVSMGARRFAVAEHVAEASGLRGTGPRGGSRVADFIAQDAFATWLGPDGRPGTYHYDRDAGRGTYGDAEHRIVLHGHEVKISRSDWLRELDDPTKAEAWSRYCDRWWLVAPVGVVKNGELPDGWGLLVSTGRSLRAAVQAPRRDPEPMPPNARAALMRAVAATASRRAA